MRDLHSVETEISGIYKWFAKEAPGVTVQEEGHLAQLWALADAYYLQGGESD